MKNFEVRMTMLVAVTVSVEAENAEAAEKLAMEKTGNDEAYYLSHYDSVWEREVIEVNECEPVEENAMKAALDYVRSQLQDYELEVYRSHINASYEMHSTPTACYDFDHIRDLLEEYGEQNELHEGWWENEGDLDDWLYEL